MRIIKGGALVTPLAVYQSDIAIRDGKIARIDAVIMPGPGDEVIDASGMLVFPGFIDGHTHLDMEAGGTVTADDFDSGTAAAVVGGTTTLVDFATQERGHTLFEGLAAWHKKARDRCHCDYGFHMAITDWNDGVRAEIPGMLEAGVTSFKCYMAYDALRLDDAALLDALRAIGGAGGLVGVHCENGALVNALVADARAKGRLSPAAHPATRPAEVEAEAISRLLYIARLADCPVQVVHLSSALGLLEVRKARARGQRVLVETCPQYLLLDESRYELPGFEGAKYVCSPPLRTGGDVQALTQAVRAGEINTIATDHCSFNFHGQKELGRADFSKIPNGLPGIEHRPALIWSALVGDGQIRVEDMCRMLSENPARQYGMYPQKGALLEGSDADIVLWKRDRGVVAAAAQAMHCDYSPYEGFPLTGRAARVFLRGEEVARDGRVIAAGRGSYVCRDMPLLK